MFSPVLGGLKQQYLKVCEIEMTTIVSNALAFELQCEIHASGSRVRDARVIDVFHGWELSKDTLCEDDGLIVW